jgi:DNA-binding LacI/PurR family transcriptional regulator
VTRKTIRIIDVAERVNVSPATVSAVLNHKAAEARISEAMQEAVWIAARELGYQPNIAARSLRANGGIKNAFYLAVISASETPLTTLGPMFQGVLAFADQSTTPIQLTLEMFHRGKLHELPGLMNGSRFNGAIIANTAPEDDAFLANTDLAAPVSVFLRRVARHNYVDSNSSDCGNQAVELLWKIGRRKFALVAPSSTTQARAERERGFRDALHKHGQSDDAISTIIAPSFDERGGFDAVAAFLDGGRQCDALFAVGDTLAFGAIAAIKQHGLSVPSDVAVIGHDDLPMAPFVDPPLTTFHIPLARMAFDAAATLVDLLNGTRKGPVHMLYTGELIVRGSSA